MQPYNAAKYIREISDHDDDQSDHGEGDNEAGVAAQQPGRRNDSEDQLKNFGSIIWKPGLPIIGADTNYFRKVSFYRSLLINGLNYDLSLVVKSIN